MKILADTNVFIKFHRRLPLSAEVETVLESGLTERFISAVTIVELFRLWKSGWVSLDPDVWLEEALNLWSVIPINAPRPAFRRSVSRCLGWLLQRFHAGGAKNSARVWLDKVIGREQPCACNLRL